MSKIKINLPQKEKEYISGLEEKLQDSPFVFVAKEEIEKYEFDLENAGYNPGIIDVFGNKVGVIMKQELRGALLDPSSDDLEGLTSAGNAYRDFAAAKYGEKAKIPPETSFGKLIQDSKINSLIMNIFRFPKDEINSEKLNLYGLDKKEVLELANQAYKNYSQTTGSLEIGGGMGCLDSVGGKGLSKDYSGNSDSVDLSSDVCEAESHYKLNMKFEKLQKDIQKNLPVLSQEYRSLETQAIKIMREHNPKLTKQIATNLFRMFINLEGLYKKGNALPIK